MSSARKLDQFYTRSEVARACLDFMRKGLPELDTALFVEPSAGAGAFFDLLPPLRRLGLDLDPRHPDVLPADFLSFNEGSLPDLFPSIVVVGNPPFGKNASLALKFVNKAARFADVVAFILPRTFRKESMLAKVAKNLHLLAEMEIGKDAFEFEGQPYDVPCVFQIWRRGSHARVHPEGALSHPDFDFVTPTDADFAIRRVGGLAGKLIEDFRGYSRQSHYYIRSRIDLDECKSRFRRLNWDSVRQNVAGNPSVSKRELVRLYREAFPSES